MSRKIKVCNIVKIDVPPEAEHEDYRDFEIRIPYGKNIFDKNGNLIGEDRYDQGGTLISRMLYKYNHKNLLTVEESYDETGELQEKLVYDYDENGRILKKFVHYLDGTVDTITYKYIGDNLSRKVLFNENGEKETEEQFSFNGDKMIKEEKFDYGKLIEKNEFKYDLNGNLIETIRFKDGKFSKVVNEYDGKRNRTRTFTYNKKDKLIGKSLYEFDEAGNRIVVQEEDRFRKNTVKMTYDENGNVTSQVEMNSDGGLNYEVFKKYDDESKLTEVWTTYFNPVLSGEKAFSNSIGMIAGLNANNAGNVIMPDIKYILVYDYKYWD